jgi:hypothetical protein
MLNPSPQKSDRQTNVLKRRYLTMAGNYCSYVVPNSTTVTFYFTKPNEIYPYGVIVVPSWNTTVWVTNKLPASCTINFGTAPGNTTSTIDVMTFQAEN